MLEQIIDIYSINKYPLFKGKNEINICYLEGCNLDFSKNDDRANIFNDLRLVFTFSGEGAVVRDKPVLLGRWEATTEPSRFYTQNPMNRKGAARIKFGYYSAWRIGVHGNSDPHEALVQVAPVSVHRDLNKDGFRTGDAIDTGLFGINQHWGYDNPVSDIGKASAGCLVGRTRAGHREFMTIVKSDPRYRANRNFIFGTAVLDRSKL